MWQGSPNVRNKDGARKYDPTPLCPGDEYVVDMGMIWITSGFLHGGSGSNAPPDRLVPKWQDEFFVYATTYSFKNDYCLVQTFEGISFFYGLIGGKLSGKFFYHDGQLLI